MNERIAATLRHLNAIYPSTRQYSVEQRGDKFVLIAPNGCEYTPSCASELEQRLVNLRIAAVGREAR